MKKFLIKSGFFLILLVLSLEILVRAFHLYTEDPPRMIDDLLVEKRVPGHSGYAVTGNRNMNFSRFRINQSGFNSKREYEPSENRMEIALVGDSFIEGFHIDYDNSLGIKLENALNRKVEVYEYGYAGYDLANQYHLIDTYEDFDKIDYIVVYLDYPTDLYRSVYEPSYDRIALLSSTLFKIRDNVKLLAYVSKIGVLDKIQSFGASMLGKNQPKNPTITPKTSKDQEYLENFKQLSATHEIDYSRTFLLLDGRKTNKDFLDYCTTENIRIIDFGAAFDKEQRPTDLVYDQHWNEYGRSVIAKLIGETLRSESSK